MPTMKSLLEVFNTWYSNSKRLNVQLSSAIEELYEDMAKAYTSTSYDSNGKATDTVHRIDAKGKKSAILMDNLWMEYQSINRCLRYCFALTSDIVTNYITILNKARII